MSAHITDSEIYGHSWADPVVRDLFTDRGRTAAWLQILRALALAQADLGLIPSSAAETIDAELRVEMLDFSAIATGTRNTGHSTAGLIEEIVRKLPSDTGRWAYYGATVQDVSDTWTGIVMRDVTRHLIRGLVDVETSLCRLAGEHARTIMLGRTHGQAGQPITFGFKAACWLAEIRRNLTRAEALLPMVAVGQLGGAVGTGAFFGQAATRLRNDFCHRLGLYAPEISWFNARDRVADFAVWLSLVTGALARIGREVYNLQRSEIGELRERGLLDVVGSITMPHKRNPEISEHLVTLARVVRANTSMALEGLVQDHERDGAAWKTEWSYIPEICMMASSSVRLGASLCDGLEVDQRGMRANIEAQGGYVFSEGVMATLVESLGKHEAQTLLWQVAREGREQGVSFADALEADGRVYDAAERGEVEAALTGAHAIECAATQVEQLLAEPSRSSQAATQTT